MNPTIWFMKGGKEHFVIVRVLPAGRGVLIPSAKEEDLALKMAMKECRPNAVSMIFTGVMSCQDDAHVGKVPYRGLMVGVDSGGLLEF
jgi:hypothetical protein